MAKNRLSQSASAYLQQHQDNPVDWYPWGEEALRKAREENKPLFLSIGYSSCHWCHVMERESFSDSKVAAFLNTHFVSIKLDREERPDIDALYMKAVQMMTGQGGWPLNVFLTPHLRPFFGGTYFPPEPRHNHLAFIDVLTQVHDAYLHQQDLIKRNSDGLTNALVQSGRYFEKAQSLRPVLIEASIKNLMSVIDRENGGFGKAPKFFYAEGFKVLMQFAVHGNEPELARLLEDNLKKITCGGIFDHLGGGFHRYSTDDKWLVPHFEKMLYDNALMAVVLTEAWKLSKEEWLKSCTEAIFEWVEREMTSEAGLFFSAIDADTEHHEGAFYTWSFQQLQELLGDQFAHFAEIYGCSETGNFEGSNILYLKKALSPEQNEKLKPIRKLLLASRAKRTQPLTDKKIQVSWNALMIQALAVAGFAFDNENYLKRAKRAADGLLERAMIDGELRHCLYDDKVSDEGFLEDYAYFAEALLELFKVSGQPRYWRAAQRLTDLILEEFYDSEVGGFWSTAEKQQDLLVRSKEIYDGALPSAYSVALSVCIRMYRLTGDAKYRQAFEKSAQFILATAEKQPGGFNRLSLALEDYFHASDILGPSHISSQDRAHYLGRHHLYVRPDEVELPPAFQDKPQGWVQCFDGACKPAVSSISDLQLR